jgi:hypothetical protein
MPQKHRLPLVLSLALCLLAPMRAAAECLPAWSEPPVVQAPESWLIGQAAADFDGDGRSDLIVASPTKLYFTPNTDGKFKYGTTVEAGTATDIRNVHAADVNGDGDMDVIIYDNFPKAIRVFPGNGDGTFGAAIQTTTGLNNLQLTPGHFDSDGKLDFAFYGFGAAVAGVFRGNGDGTFTSGGSFVSITTLARRPAAGDLNGDGFLDLVLSVANASKLLVFTGNGNGTLDAPVEVNGALDVILYVLGDVDDDDDVDIIESAHSEKAVAVILNDGNGTFAAPVLYGTIPPFGTPSGTPRGVALADLTGDGVPEITAALPSDGAIVSFRGNGDGTFGAATFSRFGFVRLGELLPADVDGDEQRDDLVVSIYDAFHGTLVNQCGDVRFQATLEHKVIGASQSTTVSALLSATADMSPASHPTGEVQLFDGTTLISSTTLDEIGSATISIEGLPLGDHQLHLHYAGDDRYQPRDSLPFALRVVSDSDVPAITIAADPVTWGYPVHLYGTVTTSAGNVQDGVVETFRGDVKIGEEQVFEGVWSANIDGDLAVGTYQYRARYKGGPSSPPSDLSAPVQVEVGKADSFIHLHLRPPDVVRVGQPIQAEFRTSPDGGTVSLFDGTTLLQTTDSDIYFAFTFTLAEGRHTLRARRHETATHRASEYTFEITSLPPGDAAIDVRVVDGMVKVAWAGSSLQEWIPNFGWLRKNNATPSFTVANAVPGNVYAFRAVRSDANGNALFYAADAVVLVAFTDEDLGKGTRMKAAHVTQLAAAINIWRTGFAMAPFSIANAAKGNVIRAADINALISGLNGARAATGMPAIALQPVAKGAKIRAADILLLRNALR